MHVGDVECAVRSVGGEDRAETFVLRVQKFPLLVSVARGDQPVGLGQHAASHETPGDFTEEHVADILGRKLVAAIHAWRGVGREHLQRTIFLAQLGPPVYARRRTLRPHRLVGRKALIHARCAFLVRIAREVTSRHEIGAQMVAIRRVVDPAVVVLRQAPLGPRVHVRLGGPLAVDLTQPTADLGGVDPVVHRPQQRALRGVRIRGNLESARNRLPFVRAAVAIAITGKHDVGQRHDQRAIAGDLQPARPVDVVHEHGAPVHASVLVRVLEHHHATFRHRQLLKAGNHVAQGPIVARPLQGPEPAAFVELNRDRILDQRFGGDDLDLEFRRHLEQADRFLRRVPLAVGQDPVPRRHRPIDVGTITDLSDERHARQQEGGDEPQ